MKKSGLIAAMILLAGMIALTVSVYNPSETISLVKFKEVGGVMNLTKGYLNVGTYSVKHDVVTIPASLNDIVYILIPDEKDHSPFIQQVKQTRNEIPKLVSDSIGCYMNGQLVSLNLPAAKAWLNTCSKEDLRFLQSVFVDKEISEDIIHNLEKLDGFPSGIGLVTEIDDKNIAKLQVILKPAWIWLLDGKISQQTAAIMNQSEQLEFLMLSNMNFENIHFDSLKKLQMLHIIEPDSMVLEQMNQLPKSISSLHFTKTLLQNLDFLNNHLQIKELTFVECGLNSIGSLKKFPHLNVLSFADCDSIGDLTPIEGLKELTWFAPPENISEQQLASIVRHSPNIESLELINCKHIKSLHMLKDLHKLSYLRLQKTPVAQDSLANFQNLKYLAYGSNEENDSVSVVKLESKLPHTVVMASEPFCMGTGWLIIFLGGILLLTFVGVTIKSKFSA